MASSQRGRWGERKEERGGDESGRKTPGSLEDKAKTDWEIDNHRKHTVSADGGVGSNRVGNAPTTCRSRVQDSSKTEIHIQLIKA